MFLEVIQPTYKKAYENDLVGHTNMIFWNIFESFLAKYGKVKPMDLEANNERLRKSYDPSDPIKTLFAQVNDANEYAFFAGFPKTDADLIHVAEVLLLKTSMFPQEYKDWRGLNPVNRTWLYFQEWWQEAYDLKKKRTLLLPPWNLAAMHKTMQPLSTRPMNNQSKTSSVKVKY